MVRLSKRLSAIAALIPKDAKVCDVGTDHGLIPVYLAENHLSSSIIASDINSGPLASAKQLAKRHHVEQAISFKLCNGLDGICSTDVNCVVIAGMGGETIISILEKAAWTKSGTTLILQPQTKSHELRRFLIDNGYAIKEERLVKDDGRIYQVMKAIGGESVAYTDVELYLGRLDYVCNDPLLKEYISSQINKHSKAAPYDRSSEDLCLELEKWRDIIR